MDDAWPILEEAFGDPSTHFNLRLRIMKATQPLSDKTVETDPNKAAMWLLQYEKAMNSILRLGDRATSLGLRYFNTSTFYKICEQLPHTIQCKVYGIEENGREKMKKIIGVVTKARTNAERRAKDKNNQSSDTTAVSSKVNIPQKEPDTAAAPAARQARITITVTPPISPVLRRTTPTTDHAPQGTT